ncbi:hypothetical protein [Streptomyces sp. NPDC048623]|uniref:hypothetical protein n=1 Tax=Streptomyces sp. NPDC048623 TaxID=3155761 RepID=UPI003431E624
MTPGYSWYALLLIALAALDGRWEWLGVALAGAVAYLAGAATGTAAYGAAGGQWCARCGGQPVHQRHAASRTASWARRWVLPISTTGRL